MVPDNIQPVQKPPSLVSLSHGAMRQGARGPTDFGHAWQDTTAAALGHARPTPDPLQDVDSVNGHKLNPFLETIPLLPDHVQVLLHLRHECQKPDDSMTDGTQYKFIKMLRALDFVIGISPPREYTVLGIATQLSVAEQMIGLGAFRTPEEKRARYRAFCNPRSRRCRSIKLTHYLLFQDIYLVCNAISARLKLNPGVLELKGTSEEIDELCQSLRKAYMEFQEERKD